MKYVCGLISFCLSIPAFGARTESSTVRRAEVQVGESCLNFRTKATRRSKVTTCLRSNSAVEIIDYNPGGFSKVSANGRTGYVYTNFLSNPEVASVTPNPTRDLSVPVTGNPILRLPPSVIREEPPAISAAGGSLTPATARVPWGNSPDRQRWTEAALRAIRENWSKLQNGRDVENFCPGYSRSSRAEKENCWLLIVGGLVKRESNFKPGTVYGEPAPLNYNSVGLLQLSHNSRAKECIPEGVRSEQDLKNPELNLRCGIRILARLVGNRGRIAGRAGAGAYWSVIRNSGEHRAAQAGAIAREASTTFRTQVAGRFPDRAIAGTPAEPQTAMR